MTTITPDQLVILAILAMTVGLFLWGRWRHDVVAAASLMACVLAGLVDGTEAFAGLGHPAVITVAAVLVLSRGLQSTGAVDVLARRLLPASAGPTASLASLAGVGAGLSAFMNNVGAMALLMPVAGRTAGRLKLPPGTILMPLAFATILGGMTTLIGTPPNLIVSGFRAEIGGRGFGLFDFTPVGLAVAVTGIAFVVLIGRRLVPVRQQSGLAGFDTGKYLTEARVQKGATAVGMMLREIEAVLDDIDAQVVGLVRDRMHIAAPSPVRHLLPDDILIIEAEPESLGAILSRLGLTLEESVAPAENVPGDDEAAASPPAASEVQGDEEGAGVGEDSKPASDESKPESAELELRELVVMPTSSFIGRSATDVRLRSRYGLNLLAVSRQGRRWVRRLRSTAVKAGDVLLLQGPPDALGAFASEFDGVPLAKRDIRIPNPRRATIAMSVMGLAILTTATGLLSAPVGFMTAVLLFVVLRVLPVRAVYDAVDWPVVVLLGLLIPVAGAMTSTGAADLIARFLLDSVAQGQPVIALVIVLVVTMTMSDFMNNAATAAVMCPVAISTAERLAVNVDPFLMAVAIGGSCAFLTPIGHQNNTLILGPGGFRFGDYWRLGLPLEILVVAIGVPVLLTVWPL